VVAFYLFVLDPAPWLGVTLIAALAALTFAPLKFLHPMRVQRLRAVNIAALAVWAALGLMALLTRLAPGPWVAGGLVVLALYFVAVGLTEKRQ
jgi:phosphatidylcholine synthase